jgi:CSLREA domain-containing protein
MIEVSTTADDIAINGNCTLREAVIAANTDTAVDACPAGSGPDTIILPVGTYNLYLAGPNEDAGRSGDLDIAGAVTIRGAGAAKTIIRVKPSEWPPADRVIDVMAGASVVLTGVTVTGGVCSNGGGIFNAGRLTVEDSRIRGNTASEAAMYCRTIGYSWGGGGIYNLGDLVLTRSEVSRNQVLGYNRGDVAFPGGGLLNQGSAVIERADFRSNYAAGGGGIWSSGELRVTDTQISYNSARFWAAGLENYGSATLIGTTISGNADGGIVNGSFRLEPGSLILENCTLSGNQMWRISGSIHNFAGPVEITHSTLSGNDSYDLGAGIGGATQQVRLLGTIVGNGTSGDCTGPVVSLGNNLDSDGSCGLGAPSDLSGLDPLLGPLAQNGGFTPTQALQAGSPAIDHIAAAECAVATDQRGVARPQPAGGACDLGAYEAPPSADIAPMIEDVKQLFQARLLTKQQEITLLEWLKAALLASANGDRPAACQALSGFEVAVSGYVDEGGLAPELAQPLLEAAGRNRADICP